MRVSVLEDDPELGPSLDFTTTALLAFALTAQADGE